MSNASSSSQGTTTDTTNTDVTMGTLSGGASSRSRSETATYQPARHRRTASAAPAPYRLRNVAEEDINKDLESGLSSDEFGDARLNALVAYEQKVRIARKEKEEALASQERIIQEQREMMKQQQAQIAQMMEQLQLKEAEKQKWVDTAAQSVQYMQEAESKIDEMATSHVSKERAEQVCKFMMAKAIDVKDQEHQAVIEQAVVEHTNILASIQEGAVAERVQAIESTKAEAEARHAQSMANLQTQIQAQAEIKHHQAVTAIHSQAEQAVGHLNQQLSVTRADLDEANDFMKEEMEARRLAEEGKRNAEQQMLNERQLATIALRDANAKVEAAKLETAKLEAEKAQLISAKAGSSSSSSSSEEALVRMISELTLELKEVKKENDNSKEEAKELKLLVATVASTVSNLSTIFAANQPQGSTNAGTGYGSSSGAITDDAKSGDKSTKSPPPTPKVAAAGGGGGGTPPPSPGNGKKPPSKGDDDGDDDKEEEEIRKRIKSSPVSADADDSDGEFSKLVKVLTKNDKDILAKEDSLKLNGLPSEAADFRYWKNAARTTIASASTEPEIAAAWFDNIKDKSFEELAKSGRRFTRLDLKIAADVVKHAKGPLATKIQLKTEKIAQEGGIIKGRQLLKMVYDNFKTNAEYGHVNDINDLQAVKMADPKNNNQLAGFLDKWDDVHLGAIDEKGECSIREKDMELIFYDRIKEIPWLSYDINVYKRMEASNPAKCYATLYEYCEKVLKDHNQQRNRKSILDKFKKNPAAPGPTKKKGNNNTNKTNTNGGGGGNAQRQRSASQGKKKGGNGGNGNNRGRSKSGRSKSGGRSSSRNSNKSNDNVCRRYCCC